MKIKEKFKTEIENSRYHVMGAIVNNEYQTLNYEYQEGDKVEFIDMSSKEGMKIYRRSLVYIMGKAFEEVYPEALITVNYQLSHSMFCEADNMELTEEMIKNVEAKMREIVSKNLDIVDYYCEDYYKYFYGMLASNTGVLGVFKLKKYDDGFLIKYPSSKNPEVVAEDVETKKLAFALNEYDDLHKVLKVSTVSKLNKAVEENRVKDIIMIDEGLHEKKIAGIADDIAKHKGVKMILIAGPSSSGKTTFAQRLGIQLKINGIKPVTISVDNYFVERPDTPRDEKGDYNFEVLEAIDLQLFNDHLTKLLNGEEVEMPEFDFKVGTKVYNGKKLKLEPDEVLVIEGIHCLNDKLTSRIPKEQKYKIYISDLTVLNMDYYNRISSTDNRLIRRIVRDYQFRGYSALHTLKSWDSVNLGEEQNIFPFQETANAMFNTSLIYELGVLKTIALPLLQEITNDNKEYAEAQRLINILKYFREIPRDYVPDNSLLKEFLGGGTFDLH